MQTSNGFFVVVVLNLFLFSYTAWPHFRAQRKPYGGQELLR